MTEIPNLLCFKLNKYQFKIDRYMAVNYYAYCIMASQYFNP